MVNTKNYLQEMCKAGKQKERPMSINVSEGMYSIQNMVWTEDGEPEHYVWEDIHHEAGRVIGEFSMSNPGKYVVSRLVRHSHRDPERPWITILRLNIELYLSTVSRVIMHEFTYSAITGDPVEWKCGHCGLPNTIYATFCGEEHKSSAGCGAPRDFLRKGEIFNPYFVPTMEGK